MDEQLEQITRTSGVGDVCRTTSVAVKDDTKIYFSLNHNQRFCLGRSLFRGHIAHQTITPHRLEHPSLYRNLTRSCNRPCYVRVHLVLPVHLHKKDRAGTAYTDSGTW